MLNAFNELNYRPEETEERHRRRRVEVRLLDAEPGHPHEQIEQVRQGLGLNEVATRNKMR